MLEKELKPRLFQPGQPSAPNRLPFTSVIIPVRNEERFIGHTLAELCSQDYDRQRFEIIVADGESTDATREVVESWANRYANIHLVHNPKRWSSAGRNA